MMADLPAAVCGVSPRRSAPAPLRFVIMLDALARPTVVQRRPASAGRALPPPLLGGCAAGSPGVSDTTAEQQQAQERSLRPGVCTEHQRP